MHFFRDRAFLGSEFFGVRGGKWFFNSSMCRKKNFDGPPGILISWREFPSSGSPAAKSGSFAAGWMRCRCFPSGKRVPETDRNDHAAVSSKAEDRTVKARASQQQRPGPEYLPQSRLQLPELFHGAVQKDGRRYAGRIPPKKRDRLRKIRTAGRGWVWAYRPLSGQGLPWPSGFWYIIWEDDGLREKAVHEDVHREHWTVSGKEGQGTHYQQDWVEISGILWWSGRERNSYARQKHSRDYEFIDEEILDFATSFNISEI